MAFNMLIVDDNAVFRMDLAARLVKEKYKVSEAGTGREALRKIKTSTYDLILTDPILPDVSGLDLVKDVRGMKIDTRIIILTGHADVSSAIEALRSGADEYIEKGTSLENIVDCINMTLQKLETMREVEHVEEKYKTILENLNDAIGVVDNEGRIAYVSSSIKKILGYDPEEMIGRSFLDFVFQADRDQVSKRVQQYNSQGSPYINSNRLLTRDGRVVWVRFSSSPLMKNGNVEKIYTVLTDISETKKLEEELIKKESRALAGELAAFVAHDINTPLQGVLSILEHCRSEHEENRQLLEYITLMRTGLLKIKSTVLNLLELEHPIVYDTTDVNLYLHKVFHLAESYLRSYGIQVELQLAGKVPNALISTKDFEQLLLEIIREEVLFSGREDWDTYPALTVFKTGKRIVENRQNDDGEELFKSRKWNIESRWEEQKVYVVFHNMDLEALSSDISSGKISMINNVIQENNCSLYIEGRPGEEKTLIIGIPKVNDA